MPSARVLFLGLFGLLFVPSIAAARPGYALLATGQVIAVESTSGKVVAKRTIGPRPEFAIPTPLLARAGDVVHSITPRPGGQSLVRLDAGDLRELGRTALPADVRFTALAVSPAGVPMVAKEGR